MFFELLLEYVLPYVVIVMLISYKILLDLSCKYYVLKAWFIVLAWIAFSFTEIYGGNKCSLVSLLLSIVLISAANALDFYQDYLSQSASGALSLTQITSYGFPSKRYYFLNHYEICNRYKWVYVYYLLYRLPFNNFWVICNHIRLPKYN